MLLLIFGERVTISFTALQKLLELWPGIIEPRNSFPDFRDIVMLRSICREPWRIAQNKIVKEII